MDPGQWMCSLCRTRFTRKSAWVRHAKRCSPSRRAASLRSRQKACTRCVRAKARCDLGQPVCSRCSLRNASCEYLGHASDADQHTDNFGDHVGIHMEKAFDVGVDLGLHGLNVPAASLPDGLGAGSATGPNVAPIYYGHFDEDDSIGGVIGGGGYASFDGIDGPDPAVTFPIIPGVSDAVAMPQAAPHLDPEVESIDRRDLFGTTVLPPTSSTEPTLIDPDPGDAIRDRWMNPLLVMNAPSSRLAAHSMGFLFRALRAYPIMLALDEGFGCPVVHSSQLLPESIRMPMANCVALARMWDGHNQQSAAIVESTIVQEMARLVEEHVDYNEDDLLAAMQALLVYAIMLFSLPGREDPRNGCFDLLKMMDLHQVAQALSKSGLSIEEEDNAITPAWEDWIRHTAKARTVLAFFCFEWAFSAYNNLFSYHCHEIGTMLAPTSKFLWIASSAEEWGHRYNRWKLRWRSHGSFRMRELMTVAPGVRVDGRVNAWLAETDEFGMMIMTLVNAAE